MPWQWVGLWAAAYVALLVFIWLRPSGKYRRLTRLATATVLLAPLLALPHAAATCEGNGCQGGVAFGGTIACLTLALLGLGLAAFISDIRPAERSKSTKRIT